MKSAMAFNGIARSPKQSSKAFASSTTRRASCLLRSNPSNFTYVVLLTDSSFPAVFPSSFEEAVTSRISSATTPRSQGQNQHRQQRDRLSSKTYFETPNQSFPHTVHMPPPPQARPPLILHQPPRTPSIGQRSCGYESIPDLPR